MTDSIHHGIPYLPEGVLDPAPGVNAAIKIIDDVLQCAVISMALSAPPGSPADGDRYIVAASGSGAWAGQDNNLAVYVAEGDLWEFTPAGLGINLVVNQDDDGLYLFSMGASPGAWILAAGLGDAPIDGDTYGRKDGAWEVVTGGGGGSLTVQDADSPPTVEVTGVDTIVAGTGLTLTDLGGGVAQLEAAGGGGGGGWDLNVDEDGTSLSNFTTISGTWTQSSGYIRANNPANNTNGAQWALKCNTGVPVANSITEVTLNIAAFNVADGSTRIGIAIDAIYSGGTPQNTSVNIALQWVSGAPTMKIVWLQPFTADSGYKTLSVSTGVDIVLRVVKMGNHVDVYLDGVLVTSFSSASFRQIQETMGDADKFIGLFCAGASVAFKNLKQWTLTQPA